MSKKIYLFIHILLFHQVFLVATFGTEISQKCSSKFMNCSDQELCFLLSIRDNNYIKENGEGFFLNKNPLDLLNVINNRQLSCNISEQENKKSTLFFKYSPDYHPFFEENSYIQIYSEDECEEQNLFGFSRSDIGKLYINKKNEWIEVSSLENNGFWAIIFDQDSEQEITDCQKGEAYKYDNSEYLVFDFLGTLESDKTLNTNNCQTNPLACSDLEICNMATTDINDKIIWQTNHPFLSKYVEIAKSKGLACQVSETLLNSRESCSDNPSICSNEKLCGYATTLHNGKKAWVSPETKYSKIAKLRGLDCDVEENKELVISFFRCTNLPKKDLKYLIEVNDNNYITAFVDDNSYELKFENNIFNGQNKTNDKFINLTKDKKISLTTINPVTNWNGLCKAIEDEIVDTMVNTIKKIISIESLKVKGLVETSQIPPKRPFNVDDEMELENIVNEIVESKEDVEKINKNQEIKVKPLSTMDKLNLRKNINQLIGRYWNKGILIGGSDYENYVVKVEILLDSNGNIVGNIKPISPLVPNGRYAIAFREASNAIKAVGKIPIPKNQFPKGLKLRLTFDPAMGIGFD